MSLKILIAPDKFKGTLTAHEAAGAIAAGWWAARPQDELEVLPMTDGGDGFGAVVGGLLGAEERQAETVDAAGRPRTARWWWEPGSMTAVIESAESNGLALLGTLRTHPFQLDTRGVGTLITAALSAGAARLLIGVGGSATNDGGFGMARTLGWEFFDGAGIPIQEWVKLSQLARWEAPPPLPEGVEATVAVDVDNPLLGLNGCTRVYGPQKGLVAAQAPIAEAALERLAALARAQLGYAIDEDAGCGAAGGLGFGLRVFLGAKTASGFELFSELSRLDERIAAADLVITGEGMLDRQSLMGKGTGRLAMRCRQLQKRCLGFAGMADGAVLSPAGNRLFHGAWSLAPGLTSPAEARKEAGVWLQRLAQKVAAEHDWA